MLKRRQILASLGALWGAAGSAGVVESKGPAPLRRPISKNSTPAEVSQYLRPASGPFTRVPSTEPKQKSAFHPIPPE
jgi:hypothetical protein